MAESAEAAAPDVSRLAADLRDATVSDRPLPAGDPTLLDRLLAGVDVIGPKRWRAYSEGERAVELGAGAPVAIAGLDVEIDT